MGLTIRTPSAVSPTATPDGDSGRNPSAIAPMQADVVGNPTKSRSSRWCAAKSARRISAAAAKAIAPAMTTACSADEAVGTDTATTATTGATPKVIASARQSSGGPRGVPPQRRAAAPSTTSRNVPDNNNNAATRYWSVRLSGWNRPTPVTASIATMPHSALPRVRMSATPGFRAAQPLTRDPAVPQRLLRRTAVARCGPLPQGPGAGSRRLATRTGSGRSAHPDGARRPSTGRQ